MYVLSASDSPTIFINRLYSGVEQSLNLAKSLKNNANPSMNRLGDVGFPIQVSFPDPMFGQGLHVAPHRQVMIPLGLVRQSQHFANTVNRIVFHHCHVIPHFTKG
jgi:hypothetical protein